MKKIKVINGITIYQNLLDDADIICEYLRKTTQYKEPKHSMNVWNEWAGNWHGLATQANGIQFKPIIGNDEDAVSQRHMFSNILKAYKYAYLDFMNEYSNNFKWPNYIKTMNLEDERWCESGVSFLKYNDKQQENLSRDTWDIAMNYHTDTNSYDNESPGTKIVITVTMYLNDSYEGGEISFYDGEAQKVYDYKPKAGDVTVFPGFEPYYHGVLPFNGDDRYLLRMFFMYDHPGDEEWLNNENKFGKEKWAEMEHERLENLWKVGANLRSLVIEGKTKDKPPFNPIYAKEDPIRIN